MKTCAKLSVAILMWGMFACGMAADEGGILVFSQSFDFSQSQDGWTADFTDFPAAGYDSAAYELTFAYTNRPANLGENQKAMFLSGHNHGDDLFMFIRKKITNLNPSTTYTIVFDVELASNVSASDVSGQANKVILKAGASATEPKRVIEGNEYTLNVGKAETTEALGSIAVNNDTKDYTLITRTNASQNYAPFSATSNSKGELWLMVGTQSAYAGVTAVYYTKVNVVFSTTN